MTDADPRPPERTTVPGTVAASLERAVRAILDQWRRSPRDRGATWMALLGLCAGWAVLATTWFDLGPTGLDPGSYVDEALNPGRHGWRFQNRQVHIMGIRVAYWLFDDGLRAARVFSIVCMWATMIGVFVVGRYCGGRVTALVAAAFVPFVPSLAATPGSLYPDPTCAAFAALALACALVALDAESPPLTEPASRFSRWSHWARNARWWLGAGAACFLAVKSKETALGVLPAVGLIALSKRGHWRNLVPLAVGLALAWIVLGAADWIVRGDLLYSARPSSYRAPKVSAALHNNNLGKIKADAVEALLRNSPLLSAFGSAGILVGARRNLALRAVGTWLIGTLVFVSLASWIYRGVFPQPRYLVSMQIALCLGAAHLVGSGLTAGVRRWRSHWGEALVWFGICSPLVLGVSVVGDLFRLSVASASRLEHYVSAVAPIVGVFALLLVRNVMFRTVCSLALATVLVVSGVRSTSEQRTTLGQQMAPFDAVARVVADDPDRKWRVGYWDIPGFKHQQLQRRLQMRSTSAWHGLKVRALKNLKEAKQQDLIFTAPEHVAAFRKAGFKKVADGLSEGLKSKMDVVAMVRKGR